jgi:hypothetical protein
MLSYDIDDMKSMKWQFKTTGVKNADNTRGGDNQERRETMVVNHR